MKSYLILLAVVLLFTTGNNLASAPRSMPSTEAFWQRQFKKVRIGMQQYRVMEFLPNRSETTQKFAKGGESYILTYALDKHWSVATGYDRSGFREKNNPYMVMGYPHDKVVVLPHLIKQENKIDEKMFPPEKPL